MNREPADPIAEAFAEALAPECWQLPEVLRGRGRVELVVDYCRTMTMQLITAADLPADRFRPGGFADPPPPDTLLAEVTERRWEEDKPEVVHKRSRYFRADEPWMAVRRSDMPVTTAAYRPGMDTLVGDTVRSTAPGRRYTEEVPVVTLGRIVPPDEPRD